VTGEFRGVSFDGYFLRRVVGPGAICVRHFGFRTRVSRNPSRHPSRRETDRFRRRPLLCAIGCKQFRRTSRGTGSRSIARRRPVRIDVVSVRVRARYCFPSRRAYRRGSSQFSRNANQREPSSSSSSSDVLTTVPANVFVFRKHCLRAGRRVRNSPVETTRRKSVSSCT